MKVQVDLVISYINNTKFYDHLRNNLQGNLSMQQLKQLVNGIQSVVRYKPESIVCSFDQAVVVVVIYGQVALNGNVYRKGQYFSVQNQKITGDLSISFLKATTLVIFNSQVLYHRIQQVIKTRLKMKIIEKCMPIKQLKLTLSQIRKLAKMIQIRQIKEKYQKIQKQKGVYLFCQGVFQIIYEDIAFLEMQNNFIQITDNLQYDISLKSLSGSYGYVPLDNFYALLNSEAIEQMEKNRKSKQEFKEQFIAKKLYVKQSEKVREKIKQKIKKSKKLSITQKTTFQVEYKQSLRTSRKTMLLKCSTTAAMTTNRSLSVSQSNKKPFSGRKNKSLSQINWPITFKSKAALNLKNISSRLDLMREHSRKKSLTTRKFPKQWYYLDEDKMKESLNLTYYQIKKSERKPENINQMTIYKRIHRIYSDPCFKRTIDFRPI